MDKQRKQNKSQNKDGGSKNLIDILKNKQGNNNIQLKEDQDSSLENNYSQGSDDDDNKQTPAGQYKKIVNRDNKQQNQQKKKSRNNKSLKKEQEEDNSSQSSSSQQNTYSSNNRQKGTQKNQRSSQNQKQTTNSNQNTSTNRSNNNNIVQNQQIDQEDQEMEEQKNQNSNDPFSLISFDSNDEEDQTASNRNTLGQNFTRSDRTNNINPSRSNNSEIDINPINNNNNNENNGNEQEDEEGNLRRQLGSRRSAQPLASLFNELLLRQDNLNNGELHQNIIRSPFRLMAPNYLMELNNLTNGSRQRQRSSNRNNSNRHSSSRRVQIQSTDAAENQIRYLYCIALSLILIFFFLLYTMQNSNKFRLFLVISLLITSLIYIFYKIKQINQNRMLQIHENNFFSYSFQNEPSSQSNGNQLNDESQQNNILIERMQNQQQNMMRNFRRYFGDMILFNSVYNIMNQLQQQNADSGYNEEQLNQIGGTHKYSDLLCLLKIQKEDDNNNQDQLANNTNNPQNQEQQQQEEEDDNSCIVCLEKFEKDTDVRILKCQHFFHLSCLDEWLKKKKECPVCRRCPLEVEPTAEQINYPNLSSAIPPIQLIYPSRMVRPLNSLIENSGQRNSRSRSRRSNMNVVLMYQ